MKDFYKLIDGSFVIGFGTNGGNDVTEISADEYNSLNEMFHTRPTAPDGYAYMIQDDPREWVLVELPPMPEPELTDAEALEIILGGGDT